MALVRYGLTRTAEHGYADRESFPAQSSVLDEEAIFSRVLPEYAISAPLMCRFFDRGDADIYRVVTRAECCYLKVYRPPHSPATAEAEGRLLTALDSQGIPVVRPVPRRDESFATVLLASEGLRPALLFEEAPPPCPRPADVEAAGALGEATARLHGAMDRLSSGVFAFRTVSADSIGSLLPHAQSFVTGEEYAFLRDSLSFARLRLAELPRERPGYGLCHADLPANLRYHDARGVTFFDFGEAAYTWRLTDCLALQRHCRSGNGDQAEGLEAAFRTGYQRVLPLPVGLDSHQHVLALAEHIAWIGKWCASTHLRMGTERLAGFLPEELAEVRKQARRAAT